MATCDDPRDPEGPGPDSKLLQALAKRFRQAVDQGEEVSRLRAILGAASRDEVMRCLDDNRLDLLHYCILRNNVEAADFLLKQNYFARPHQPQFSLYLHLAAFLGLRAMISVLVQHRPDDFCIAQQPLLVPPEYVLLGFKGGGAAAGAAVAPRRTSGQSLSSTQTLAGPPDLAARYLQVKRSNTSFQDVSFHPKSPTTPEAPKKLGKRGSTPGKMQMFAPTIPEAPEKAGRREGPGRGKADSLNTSTARTKTTDATAKSSGRSSALHRGSDGGGGVDSSPEVSGTMQNPLPRTDTVQLDGLQLDGSAPLLRTPLYVAAVACRLDCLRTLLDVCVLKAHPETPSKGYLTLAALADCPTSLTLLLKHLDVQDKGLAEDFKAAVTYCVQSARPECLDLLLKASPKGLDVRNFFLGINFFHVLYTFSASYGKGVYARLPDTTQVLLSHGHHAAAKVPPRTYPLYTLLNHSVSYEDYGVMQFYISCMKMLLKAGADPNFDEVEFEKELLKKKGIKFAAGRNAFSSALHCLLETVETFASLLQSKYLAVRFIQECADVLIASKADVSKVGRIGDARSTLQGNILHQYAKSSVILGVDKGVIQCLYRYGADPDVKINGKYAINVYLDKLLEMLSELQLVDAQHRYREDVCQALTHFCRFMSSRALGDAARLHQGAHSRSTSQQVKYYAEAVVRELEFQAREVRSLQRMAAWRLWLLCGKRPEIVRHLPLKVEFKTVILPFLPENTRDVYFPR